MFPKGLGGLGDMANMMKTAMEMKGRMEQMKEQLANETVEASSGGGMVKVVMTGKMQLVSLEIDPEIINKDEKEMLETLVRAAVNEGVEKVQAVLQSKMREVAGGIDIPGLTS
ncbi:MAG: hypothetical protein AMXMBFR84_48540 [Candidatus Hydrogenedentota bacterium]